MKKKIDEISGREYQDITQHEIEALKFEYNLADAHTHQSQSPTQREIINKLPELWYEAEKTKQHDMEQKFVETFFRVQKQEYAIKTPTMLVYASSIAIVMAANYLMKKKMSVSLLEPCFDNLHDIFKHMQIEMSVLREEWLHDPSTLYENLEKHVKSDAIFIIDPNNPTGFTLFSYGDKAYSELIRFANDKNKLLLIDYCFAPFIDYALHISVIPIYEMLEQSGVSYIAIEDTGKTYPIQDTKVAMIKTSKDLYEELYNIHTSYLLNVSPFILNLATQYILDSEKDKFESVYRLLDKNRSMTKDVLASSLLEFQEPQAHVSVAWFKIKNPKVKATELQKIILAEGVYVLPGTYFFWSDHKQGEQYMRIALARNTEMFEPAIKLVRSALDKYEKTL